MDADGADILADGLTRRFEPVDGPRHPGSGSPRYRRWAPSRIGWTRSDKVQLPNTAFLDYTGVSNGGTGTGAVPPRATPRKALTTIGNSALPPAPDSEIALWNRPADKGEPIEIWTDPAPADSPNKVTLAGSPAKVAMLRLTHLSAAI